MDRNGVLVREVEPARGGLISAITFLSAGFFFGVN